MSDKPPIPSWQRAQAASPPPVAPADQEPATEAHSEGAAAAPVAEAGAEDTARDAPETDHETLLQQASTFLADATIRDAPREKKITFLQSKGVTVEDIESLLGPSPEEDAPDLSAAGERAWGKTPSQKPAPTPQPREIPPIVTYPEFLTQTEKPPPLITTNRLLSTVYVAGGLAATMYGLSKFIIAPMAQTLTDSRHEFASYTQEQLEELNKRLGEAVSIDPAKNKSVMDVLDDISEADSDPTELFHRDFGTQTTPSLSRRPSVTSVAEVDSSMVTAHDNRLKIIASHLKELEATRSNDGASTDSLRTKISDLTTYLSEMSYQNSYYSGMGSYASNYGLPKSKDGKEDYMETFKADIRAVKGVLLSARNFPAGGPRGSTATGRVGPNIMTSNFHLPFGHSKSPAPSQSKEESETSLTTLLTSDQCADLTFLIAMITAAMRKSLIDTFTAEESTIPLSPKKKSEDDALRAAPSNLSEIDIEKEERLKKEKKEREEDSRKELALPETQELKKAMLKYFDEWRGKIIVRIGEIVNSREEAKGQEAQVSEVTVAKAVKRANAGTKSIADLEDRGENENEAFKELYPPMETVLTSLDESKRALVLHSLVLIVLSLEHYSGHSRVLLLYLASSLHLPLSVLKRDEETIARGLLEAADQQLNADAETKKKNEEHSSSRKWKVGLASVAGAALIGVTGGLAAPLLAAGIGTVMGGLGLGATAAAGYLGTLAGSSVLVGSLFGAYGARMTGKAMDDYAREVEDFGFIPIHDYHRPRKLEKEFRRLRIAIAISGWLTSKEEVVVPWRYMSPSIEGFALRWELEALLKLGNSMESFVTSAAWGYAKAQIIKRTVFGALSAGLWPLGLLKISSILDNPFSVAKYRADKAGEVLADALINKVQGERPVTLIGYSLGARLIYSCLQTLAERKAFGLIENVVLLGTPAPSDTADWRKMRSVVSGRLVNVFSTNDYILAFLYRTSSIQLGVGGLEPVMGVHGVQNVDVSELVSGHLRYRYLTGSILKKIGFEDIDIKEVEQEESEMRAVEEMERKAREKKEKGGKSKTEEEEKKELEEEVEKKNKESIMSWAMEKVKLGGLFGGGKEGEKSKAEEMAEKEEEIQK
ncbi:DUF726-domain-containing protein, partial [Amniculicola lignicola CBS 123094]